MSARRRLISPAGRAVLLGLLVTVGGSRAVAQPSDAQSATPFIKGAGKIDLGIDIYRNVQSGTG